MVETAPTDPGVTVLGAAGFIGRNLVALLRTRGRAVTAVTRDNLADVLAAGRPAGHVIDCIGLTADFRTRRLETAESHVGLVARALAELDLSSYLMLSSTRLYARATSTREDLPLLVQPADLSDLYNLTKLAAEALCLSDPRPVVRVARVSNVYGDDMGRDSFLGQVMAEQASTGRVVLRQALHSAKDYISIEDTNAALLAIAERGGSRLYNVACGFNTTHDMIVHRLEQEFGWRFEVIPTARAMRYPRVDITRLATEFGPPPSNVLDDLPRLAVAMRRAMAG